MSIPPPDYARLYQSLLKHIDYHGKLVDEVQQQQEAQSDLTEVVKNLFGDIKNQFQAHSKLDRRTVHQIAIKAYDRIDKIFHSHVYRDSPSLDQEKCEFICASLKEELLSFEQVVHHKSRLERKGLEGCLNTRWGWVQFEQLTKINDPWAISTLRTLLANHDKKAIFLVIDYQAFDSIHPIIMEFKEDIDFQESLQEILDHDDDESQKIYDLIELVLMKQDWDWGEKVLEQQGHLVKEVLWRIFEREQNQRRWINQFIISQLEKNLFLGIHFFAAIFSQESGKAPSLVEPLIRMAVQKNSVDFDLLLLAFAALSDPKNELLQNVEHILSNLEDQRREKKGLYKKILDQLLWKKKELTENYISTDTENPWTERADFRIACTYQLLAIREYNLIHWLENGFKINEVDFVPIVDCFAKTSALMLGYDMESPDFIDEIRTILNQHQFTVYTPVTFAEEDEIEVSDKHILLTSDQEIDVWVQDYCYVGLANKETHFRFPNWIIHPNFKEIPRNRLQSLFPKEYENLNLKQFEFRSMGSVAQWQSQLELLGYILQIDPQLTMLSFQFTFNEGGNCLIGGNEKGPFALIGKDARDLNRLFLTKELASLGFRKNQSHQWELKEPYEEQDLDLLDEDLKIFFARDLGVKADQIFFIEQADYHLDMSICLFGGNRVGLNDSMLAYEQAMKKANAQIAKSSGMERGFLEQRLKLLYEKASKMKFFEDLAAADLQKQGFDVIRFAGIFEDVLQSHPENHQTNFFNNITLTTVDDKKIIIAMGCSEDHQKDFREMIQTYCQFQVDEIHFLNQEQSEAFLLNHGGAHCVSKILPGLLKNS